MPKKSKPQKSALGKKTQTKKPQNKDQKNQFGLQPLSDRVVIKEDSESKERTTSAGIIIPVTVNEDKGSKRGVVVAVGPGRTEDGKLVPVNVKVGNVVLFQWGDKIKVAEEEYFLVRESEILAVIK